MNLIIEGPDNSGKSTLAGYLSRVLKMPVIEGKGPPKSVDEINQRVISYSQYKGVIFDRHPAISNRIYDIARGIRPQIRSDVLQEFFFKGPDKIIIFCRGDRTLGTHVVKDDEDPAHIALVNEHHRMICDLYDTWSLHHSDIIFDKHRSSMQAIARMVASRLIPSFDPVEDIHEFHTKFGLLHSGSARHLEGELGNFRSRFLQEELDEYVRSQEAIDHLKSVGELDPGEYTFQLGQQLDALVDLVYVALGNAHLQGFDFREAWRRVHRANMRKVRAQSADQSKRGTAFDVVKPVGWEAPDHSDLVEVNDYEA